MFSLYKMFSTFLAMLNLLFLFWVVLGVLLWSALLIMFKMIPQEPSLEEQRQNDVQNDVEMDNVEQNIETVDGNNNGGEDNNGDGNQIIGR